MIPTSNFSACRELIDMSCAQTRPDMVIRIWDNYLLHGPGFLFQTCLGKLSKFVHAPQFAPLALTIRLQYTFYKVVYSFVSL